MNDFMKRERKRTKLAAQGQTKGARRRVARMRARLRAARRMNPPGGPDLPDLSRALSPKEIAAHLGVDRRTIERYCQTGYLKATRKGKRQWAIMPDDFTAFVKRHENVGPKV